jgi:hypothetical protein
MRFSLLQLMLLSAALALGLGLHLSSQRAQDYWRDQWYFEPQSVDFSPDGKQLVISFPSGEVEVIEITPTGFRRRPCSARWAGRTGLGHPRFVTNNELLFYQDHPSSVRQPGIAKWDVRNNRATAGSPFYYAAPGVPLEGCYGEKSGVGVLLEPQGRRFIVAPDRAEGHRHLVPPKFARLESWDLTSDGKQIVVLGIVSDELMVPSHRVGKVMDIESGVVVQSFRPDNQLPSPMSLRPRTDELAVIEVRSRNGYEVVLREKRHRSVTHRIACDVLDPRLAYLGPLRFSHHGNRLVVDGGLGKVQIVDIDTKRAIETIEAAPPLLVTHPRATGYILGAARMTKPQRVALSPDGKAFAIVQDMHVELWEVDSNRYLGRAWKAWDPWGPIRRHMGLLLGFGVLTGLIWRWQRKQMASRAIAWQMGAALSRLLLLACGVLLIVRLVPPLFLPENVVSSTSGLFLIYGVLFTGVLAIAFAIGWPQRRQPLATSH